MSAYQCWLAQRERLRDSLKHTAEASSAATLTRHTLAQVEQNTMAEQTDDLLRQQTGILFSCLKTSLNLLDISVATKVWVAQSAAAPVKRRSPGAWSLALACGLTALVGWFAYARNLPALWIPLAAALAAIAFGWVSLGRARRAQPLAEDQLRVTAMPEPDKLFAAIDAQMKAIDRYINDFSYLNEQNTLLQSAPESGSVAHLAALMEAVENLETPEAQDVTAAADRLLEGSGIRALRYTAADAGYFTVLPSLNETRTLAPALVSARDGALLRRGTAAVFTRAPGAPSPAESAAEAAQPTTADQ